jgi:hypothetical protein
MSNDPANYLSGTELRVCQLIAERQMRGIAKYGTTVSDNPLPLRAWLRHALEETLDNAIYLQRAIEELDNTEPPPRQKTIEELMKPYLSPQLVDFKPTNYQVEP